MERNGRRDKDVLAVMRGLVGWGVLALVVIGDGRACFEYSGWVYLYRRERARVGWMKSHLRDLGTERSS